MEEGAEALQPQLLACVRRIHPRIPMRVSHTRLYSRT